MDTMILPFITASPVRTGFVFFGIFWARLCHLAENAPDEVFAAKVNLVLVKRHAGQ
jgi:hypothetical protein